MKFKLPLDNNKEYIFTKWKDFTLAVFDRKNFENYYDFLMKKEDKITRIYVSKILSTACLLEYDNVWEIPEVLLSYINFKDSFEIIDNNIDEKSPIFIIKAINKN